MNVEWTSIHCIWHGNAKWVQRCSQSLVASLSYVPSIFCGAGESGVALHFAFHTWVCAANPLALLLIIIIIYVFDLLRSRKMHFSSCSLPAQGYTYVYWSATRCVKRSVYLRKQLINACFTVIIVIILSMVQVLTALLVEMLHFSYLGYCYSVEQ